MKAVDIMGSVDKLISEMEKIEKIILEATTKRIEVWNEFVFLSWRWWFLLLSFIIAWTLWVIFRKKESTDRLLYAGVVTMLVSILLDGSGYCIGLWYYNYEVVPIPPINLEYDIGLLPVMVMFFIQIKPKVHPFIKGVILSGFTSFVYEPIFKALDFFAYPKWEYIYSFVIYIIIYLIANYVSTRNNFTKIKN